MLKSLAMIAAAGLFLPAGPPDRPPIYPFKVGETLRYTATLGYLPVGEASFAVTGTARERGAETFVFSAAGEGGPPGLGVSYQMTSWVGTEQVHLAPVPPPHYPGRASHRPALSHHSRLGTRPAGGQLRGLGHHGGAARRAGVPVFPAHHPARGRPDLCLVPLLPHRLQPRPRGGARPGDAQPARRTTGALSGAPAHRPERQHGGVADRRRPPSAGTVTRSVAVRPGDAAPDGGGTGGRSDERAVAQWQRHRVRNGVADRRPLARPSA